MNERHDAFLSEIEDLRTGFQREQNILSFQNINLLLSLILDQSMQVIVVCDRKSLGWSKSFSFSLKLNICSSIYKMYTKKKVKVQKQNET